MILATPKPASPADHVPLWQPSATRDKIVVVSDLHLGIDDAFAEDVANRTHLVDFLRRLQQTSDVRELVINGDFLDDWYLPLTYAAYNDPRQFYAKVIANNQVVIDELNRLVASGIKFTYVPGNHDMLLESGVLAEAVPGTVEARDAAGLGLHRTGDRGEVVIEHGHRYDVFSAPDSVTNAALAHQEATMLPPGYFYARIAASWILQGRPPIKKDYPEIASAPEKSDIDQYGAYVYYRVLSAEMNRITPFERFEDHVFDLDFAGLHGSYSLQDFYPVAQPDGRISAPTLFVDIQRTWNQRQEINKVQVSTSFIEAAAGALDIGYFAKQAIAQYLHNPAERVEVVVFGHTHIPDYRRLPDGSVYLNEGTWIDHNVSYPAADRTFALITTGEHSSAAVYEYRADGSISDITASITKDPPA
ncbi:metallophosphoesterase [Propionicimonas sp.]|uniref:metallophosphoesterase n=1 Tax=Propionicimonas sp. TaxID=1955623 RepID=UPI001850C09D|nr:metallophosphoesterase [Propionicimonas sp.]MBU3976353.1 metallophosphoesterase [Actinomycetota bacterium]MBA3022054.1 metallophosphoesterase [Propionicimonas sp.]MBU3987510.1 metallophosphoesterase [Actinomycetota bacterium]MBU4006545.1 metallophosphoesterase [Actinomycetota bacterium]MBU4065150.1 metallophosphoesterase [Actinomycetota bacterium]